MEVAALLQITIFDVDPLRYSPPTLQHQFDEKLASAAFQITP
jgi:hypothetical protein